MPTSSLPPQAPARPSLADLFVPRVAVAGVFTHLPGLFYIAALNAIMNSTSSVVNRIFQVAM